MVAHGRKGSSFVAKLDLGIPDGRLSKARSCVRPGRWRSIADYEISRQARRALEQKPDPGGKNRRRAGRACDLGKEAILKAAGQYDADLQALTPPASAAIACAK